MNALKKDVFRCLLAFILATSFTIDVRGDVLSWCWGKIRSGISRVKSHSLKKKSRVSRPPPSILLDESYLKILPKNEYIAAGKIRGEAERSELKGVELAKITYVNELMPVVEQIGRWSEKMLQLAESKNLDSEAFAKYKRALEVLVERVALAETEGQVTYYELMEMINDYTEFSRLGKILKESGAVYEFNHWSLDENIRKERGFQRVFTHFPDMIIIPIIRSLDYRDLDLTHASGVYFAEVPALYADTRADGIAFSAPGYFFHDVIHAWDIHRRAMQDLIGEEDVHQSQLAWLKFNLALDERISQLRVRGIERDDVVKTRFLLFHEEYMKDVLKNGEVSAEGVRALIRRRYEIQPGDDLGVYFHKFSDAKLDLHIEKLIELLYDINPAPPMVREFLESYVEAD